MTISYGIPVCNEIEEIKRLIEFLIKHKHAQDEIVIVVDEDNGTDEVKNYVEEFSREFELENIKVFYHPLNKDFATHKNFINFNCSGDYIVQLDADELPDVFLMNHIHEILEANQVEAIWVPRINIVNGISQQHIDKWGWTINEFGWINWPRDAQLRVYVNKPQIKWEGKVHERITGYKSVAYLPNQKEFALWHVKQIDRQEKQNQFYSEI